MIKNILREREITELLPYEGESVSELDQLIKNQEEVINESEASSVNENFFAMIYKTEIERLKYLLKAYLRTRLFKIQKFYLYIIKNEKCELLSESEYEFAVKYFLHKRNHFRACFSNDLHEALNDFVDPSDESEEQHKNTPVNEDLVMKPSLKRPIFIRMLRDMPRVNDFAMETKENLKNGQIMLVPYESCKDLIEASVAEVV